MLVRRRQLLRGAAATLAASPAHAGAANKAYIEAIAAALARSPAGPVLLNSYVVTPGGGDFDLTQANAAYVYDNALAGLALHAGGFTAQAGRIAQALALVQGDDRFWHDGRLRNAYRAGAVTAPASLPGWWDGKAGQWREDAYQAGTATGPLAWAMLLWLALGMRDPAARAAAFLDARLRAAQGYFGGFYGFEPSPLKQAWQSTEQNVDVAVAMRCLGRQTQAASAAGFVRAMVGPGGAAAGLAPDGARNLLVAADAGIWPYLAGLAPAAAARATVARLRRDDGIGFSSASRGVWLEGTAFAALALRRAGDRAQADAFMRTVAANVAKDGYVYATVAPAEMTGLTVGPALRPGEAAQPFIYLRRPSLSATAWAALAAMDVNPLFF